MYMKTMRSGGSASRPAVSAVALGAMVSSHGRASAAPAPRNTDRREILLELIGLSPFDLAGTCGSFDHHRAGASRRGRRRFYSDLASLAVAERNAEHDLADQRSRAVVTFLQAVGEPLDGAAIAILQTASEGVAEQLAGEL